MVTREKVAAREERSPRDTLSINLLVICLSMFLPTKSLTEVKHNRPARKGAQRLPLWSRTFCGIFLRVLRIGVRF
jgi:hypothetical protein